MSDLLLLSGKQGEQLQQIGATIQANERALMERLTPVAGESYEYGRKSYNSMAQSLHSFALVAQGKGSAQDIKNVGANKDLQGYLNNPEFSNQLASLLPHNPDQAKNLVSTLNAGVTATQTKAHDLSTAEGLHTFANALHQQFLKDPKNAELEKETLAVNRLAGAFEGHKQDVSGIPDNLKLLQAAAAKVESGAYAEAKNQLGKHDAATFATYVTHEAQSHIVAAPVHTTPQKPQPQPTRASEQGLTASSAQKEATPLPGQNNFLANLSAQLEQKSSNPEEERLNGELKAALAKAQEAVKDAKPGEVVALATKSLGESFKSLSPAEKEKAEFKLLFALDDRNSTLHNQNADKSAEHQQNSQLRDFLRADIQGQVKPAATASPAPAPKAPVEKAAAKVEPKVEVAPPTVAPKLKKAETLEQPTLDGPAMGKGTLPNIPEPTSHPNIHVLPKGVVPVGNLRTTITPEHAPAAIQPPVAPRRPAAPEHAPAAIQPPVAPRRPATPEHAPAAPHLEENVIKPPSRPLANSATPPQVTDVTHLFGTNQIKTNGTPAQVIDVKGKFAATANNELSAAQTDHLMTDGNGNIVQGKYGAFPTPTLHKHGEELDQQPQTPAQTTATAKPPPTITPTPNAGLKNVQVSNGQTWEGVPFIDSPSYLPQATGFTLNRDPNDLLPIQTNGVWSSTLGPVPSTTKTVTIEKQ